MKKEKVTIGIDVGGTNTSYGFIDENGNYLFGDRMLTISEEDSFKFVYRLSEAIKETYNKYLTEYFIDGIGIAAPGANYFMGTIEAPSNLNWGKVNFVSMMKEFFNVPIAITNDANAAALGEQAFGSAVGMKNFIVITLGTGLGSGIMVDGELLYGESGLAGELGHTIVEADGRKCKCGRSGCLETYVSASGLRRTVFQLLSGFNDESGLRDISFNQMNGKVISDFGTKNDPIAIKAFEFTGRLLGMAIANAAAYFSPEAVILCGGLVNAGNLLLEPTRRHFEENVLSAYKGKVKIYNSTLQNGMAAILGARNLIIKELKKNQSVEINKLQVG